MIGSRIIKRGRKEGFLVYGCAMLMVGYICEIGSNDAGNERED